MSHFECRLNRRFWRWKKSGTSCPNWGEGGGRGNLDIIQKNSNFFRETFPRTGSASHDSLECSFGYSPWNISQQIWSLFALHPGWLSRFFPWVPNGTTISSWLHLIYILNDFPELHNFSSWRTNVRALSVGARWRSWFWGKLLSTSQMTSCMWFISYTLQKLFNLALTWHSPWIS